MLSFSMSTQGDSFPFAGRLSRFPDAWLLPLFPLLLRFFLVAYHAYTANGSVADSNLMPALRRLCCYIILFNFRGWVLYLLLNEVEDSILKTYTDACWYHNYLRDDQPECCGRVFDFSDHVVLYFAQILPIALLEFLHSWEYPYWSSPRTSRYNLEQAPNRLVPVVLIGGMTYLYFITYLGVYKTGYFFHTGAEVIAGFIVSLLVHIPLCCLQCSDRCQKMRDFLFANEKAKILE